MTKRTKSEFGKGFVYNLFLFGKHVGELREHVERYRQMRKIYPDRKADYN